MSYYNHFSENVYTSVCFGSLNTFDKFRMDKWVGKRRRKDIVMVKLSDLSYKEFKSRKVYHVIDSDFDVYSYNEKRC